jgi:hypothetical protein
MPDFLNEQALDLKEYLTKSTDSLKGSALNIDEFVKQQNSMKDISKRLAKVK